MALNAEFKKHLHELMVEVALKLQDEEAHYKNALVGKAIQTHNAAQCRLRTKMRSFMRLKIAWARR